ncbi:Apoptosis-inducing factor A [Vanrija pseudolonga]|uniref:Apoptosis-inducing factor A n=1 Tax=Vanrija pseudolonga TaxID=143232 RepID=A0AAF1BK91_9TREE|nr:Apoptosis-inducing factor A [Vanrija pseudolonga]
MAGSIQKNVVVIGASVAGHSFVNALADKLPADHRILLVERNGFTVHLPAVVRALVVPGWESKNLTAEVTQASIFKNGSRHRVLSPNSVVELKKTSLVLEHPFEGSNEVTFVVSRCNETPTPPPPLTPLQKAIIATGASQPLPMRPTPGSTLEGFKTDLVRIQKHLKAAKSIAIIGGGTVGTEVAGEISELYPNKQLTIVHSDKGLLQPSGIASTAKEVYSPPPTDRKLSVALEKTLKQRSVNVVLNDKVVFPSGPVSGSDWDGTSGPQGGVRRLRLQSGKSIEADYVFVSIGNTPNSGLVKAADPTALTNNNYIKVNSYFRVLPGSSSSVLAGEYYAIGDVAAVAGWKTAVAAAAEGPALAGVIEAEIKGKKPKAYSPPAAAPLVVSLGTKEGSGYLPLPIFGNVTAPGFVIGMKTKDFFAGKSFYPRFQGAQKISA